MQSNLINFNSNASFNLNTCDFQLKDSHKPTMTLTQLHSLVRIANVEYSLDTTKPYSYHIWDALFKFCKKTAIGFLQTGVGLVFFDAPKNVVLALVGRYFLGEIREVN